MKLEVFLRRTRIDAPAETVFRWHAQPNALRRLTPPWEAIKEDIAESSAGITVGARAVLRFRIGPMYRLWVSEHRTFDDKNFVFSDEQVKGPFQHWYHVHRFEPDGPEACYLEDRVEYTLPFGRLGKMFAGGFVEKRLDRMFAYRHRITAQDLALHSATKKPMTVIVTGSNGLVGSALVSFLTTGGHRVIRLVRSPQQARESTALWDPSKGVIDASALEGADAVVHLAGENISQGRWTTAKKQRIRDSRINGTRLLSETLSQLARPPKVMMSASAIGYYGDRGEQELSEDSVRGAGFLADVCEAWENAVAPAVERGIRVVNLRSGIVLTPAGGSLGKMLFAFQLGIGGVLGNGRQYVSWIAMDDMISAIYHTLLSDKLHGPVNLATPQPVTNIEFTNTLGRVLHRPTLLPVPAAALRLVIGELANEVLASARVIPAKLLQTGYTFLYPQLESALRHLLGKM